MRIRTLFPVAVLGVALVVGSCGGGSSSRSAASSGATATAWDHIVAGIGSHGEVSKQTALQAFAFAVGPLPGVTVPAGRQARIESGSGAVRWLLSYWKELSGPQRDAVVRDLGMDPFAPPAVGGLGRSFRAGRRADSPGATKYRVDFDLQVKAIEAKIGRALSLPTSIVVDKSGTGLGDAYTYARGPNGSGPATGCEVHLSPHLQTLDASDLRVALAHEAWHCFEAAVVTLDRFYDRSRSWIYEGQAAWVGETVAGPSTKAADWAPSWWEDYLKSPPRPLFARSYDAIGFYAHLAERNVDPWAVFDAMLNSADDPSAFATAVSGAGDAFDQTWASGLFRDPSLGAAWDTTGPNIPGAGIHGPAVTRSVADGASVSVAAPPYTNALYEVTSSADVTEFTITGTGRVGGSGGVDLLAQTDAPLDLCTKQSGACTCPGNASPPLTRSQGTLRLGVTGGPQGSNGTVTGQSLDSYCKRTTTTTTGVADRSGQAWCAMVIDVNTRHGTIANNHYIQSALRDATKETAIAQEATKRRVFILSITPPELVAAQTQELDYFAAFLQNPATPPPANFLAGQQVLIEYQKSACGIVFGS